MQTKKTKQIFAPSAGSGQAGDQLIATIETVGAVVTPYYDHTDHLNSISVVSNSTGALIETLDYYPYGSQRISSGTYTNQRQYIGQIYDVNTGFDYLNARYYKSSNGRFISEDSMFLGDPASQNLQNPQSMNSYSYASNNPITFSDPNGKWTQGQIEGANYLYGNSSFWHIALDNPYLPAIIGSYPIAVVMSGGSLSTGLVGLAGGVSAQYVGDVAGNLANGKTGGDLVRPTSSATQYAISVASVGLTSSIALKALPLTIGGISAGTSFVQDRASSQPVTTGGIFNNIVNGIGAMATEGVMRQASGISGRLPSNNSTADFIGAHAIANYTKQAVSAAGQFVTSAVSSIVNKLSGSH
jgi:RHS repeat-associated protein